MSDDDKKPKQKLGKRIKRKARQIGDDIRQAAKRGRGGKSSRGGGKPKSQIRKVKDSKAPKKKTPKKGLKLNERRVKRLAPISKVKYGNVKRAKRAKRTINRILDRQDNRYSKEQGRASKKLAKQQKGPTSENASQGMGCGPKGCAAK